MRNYILILLSCLWLTGNAQTLPHDNLMSTFGYTPNAPDGGSGQSISVDPYTGKLQAAFPLFSFTRKSSGLSHSISLNYIGGGGIRVDDPASNIGLGWTLGIAGTISRDIRGVPDEDEWGYSGNPSLANLTYDSARFRRIVDNHEDGEQDIYRFTAGNRSGSFVIGKNNQIVQIPSSNCKIDYSPGPYNYSGQPLDSCFTSSFKITIEDGTQYIYTATDCSKFGWNDPYRVHGNYVSSTYYLTHIVSAFGTDTIFFDYAPHILEYNAVFSFTRYTTNTGNVSNPNYRDFDEQNKYKARVREQRLTAIRYPDGTKITVNYDAFGRLDMHSDNAISSIIITNNLSNKSYGYRFYYSYSQASSSATLPYLNYSNTSNWSYPEEQYRLTLDSFSRFGGTDTLPAYNFIYNQTRLPLRGSGGIDHWGFYNSSNGRIPSVNTSSYPNVPGASKEPIEVYAEAAVLKKVIFPTGGSAYWDLELNTLPSSGATTQTTYYYSDDSLQKQIALQAWFDNDTFNSASAFYPIPGPTNSPSSQVHHVLSIAPATWPAALPQNINITLSVWKRLPHGNLSAPHKFDKLFTYNDFINHIGQTADFYADKSDTFAYRVYLSDPNYSSTITDYSFDVDWKMYSVHVDSTVTTTTIPVTNVGGLRVKSLVLSDGLGQNNDMVKDYRYVMENGESSGVMGGNPIYSFNFSETYNPSPTDPNRPTNYSAPSQPYDSYNLVSYYVNSGAQPSVTYGYLVRSSAAMNSLFYTHGNPVGYKRVEEYQGPASNYLHKTAYEFTTLQDCNLPSNLTNNQFPFQPMPEVDYRTGLLKRLTEYNAAGKKLKTSQTDYLVYTTSLNNADFINKKIGASTTPPTSLSAYTTSDYYQITGKVFPIKNTMTEYYANNDSLVTVSETVFDTAYMIPKLIKNYNAKNELIITRYYYPYDFNIGGPVATLKNQNITFSPIRTEVWKDSSKVLNAAVSNFQTIGNGQVKQLNSYSLTPTAPIPLSTYGSFNSNQLMPTYSNGFSQLMNLEQYDNVGNLTQSTQNGVTTATIWGYNRSFPIATVVNATTNDIAYSGFETIENTGWTASLGLTNGIITPFTGNKSGRLSGIGASISKSSLSTTKTYTVSMWAAGFPQCSITTPSGSQSITLTSGETHNGWKYYSATFTNATAVTISGTVTLDDLRLFPSEAMMATFSYDPLIGITSETDAANRTTYYEYDNFGRLIRKRNLDGNIIQTMEYQNKQVQ